MQVKNLESVRMDELSLEFSEIVKAIPNQKEQCLLSYSFNAFKELCASAVQVEACLKGVGFSIPAVSTLSSFLDFDFKQLTDTEIDCVCEGE